MAENFSNNNKVKMTAELTKGGFIALWEEGGGYTNTGSAVIIAKGNGDKPTATYIRRRGMLSCEEHALVPVHTGYFVIKSNHHRGDFYHEIYKITRTFTEGEGENKRGFIEASLVNKFDEGEWSYPLGRLKAAVAAAEEKATTYHCRSAVYVVEKEKKS